MARAKQKLLFVDTSTMIELEKMGSFELLRKLSRSNGAGVEPLAMALSTITISEILVKAPSISAANDFMCFVNQSFEVYDFDAQAAMKSASIYAENIHSRSNWSGRPAFKCDTMILATALVNNAAYLITEDKQFLDTARKYISAESISDMVFQMDLPFQEDNKK